LVSVIYSKRFATVVRKPRIFCTGEGEARSCNGSGGKDKPVLIGNRAVNPCTPSPLLAEICK